MGTENFKDAWKMYQNWMLEIVNCPKNRRNLLLYLDRFVFDNKCEITDDFNRISDAIYMRNDFWYNNDILVDIPDNRICGGYCSVLELLVSFSIRIDKEWTGAPDDPNPGRVFWKLIENLGLLSRLIDGSQIEQRIYGWMCGNIARNGIGGLFPLRRNKDVDQRNKSIWEQMMPWIQENFNDY